MATEEDSDTAPTPTITSRAEDMARAMDTARAMVDTIRDTDTIVTIARTTTRGVGVAGRRMLNRERVSTNVVTLRPITATEVGHPTTKAGVGSSEAGDCFSACEGSIYIYGS